MALVVSVPSEPVVVFRGPTSLSSPILGTELVVTAGSQHPGDAFDLLVGHRRKFFDDALDMLGQQFRPQVTLGVVEGGLIAGASEFDGADAGAVVRDGRGRVLVSERHRRGPFERRKYSLLDITSV
jgi:hypothetical protein